MKDDITETVSRKNKKKEISICGVCMDTLNISNRMPVECFACNFIACRCCYKRYITENNEIAKCMNCKKEWDYNIVCEKFERSFIDCAYKKHRENILYDQEMALMVTTQPYVEGLILQENIKMRLDDLYDKKCEYDKNYIRETEKIRFEGITKQSNEKRVFVRKCSYNECKGFLSSSWKCTLCKNWSCSKCHDVIGEAKDNHVCNPDILATTILLQSDTKSCPSCHMGITKIDGCNMMFCVECHTAFDWKTGKISTGVIHNPHYFEWRSKGGIIDREIGDIRCGRQVGNNEITMFRRVIENNNMDYSYSRTLIENIRRIIHIREVDLPRYNTNLVNDNIDLRAMFMRNLISEPEFRRTLQIRDKKTIKYKRCHNAISMFTDCATEIIYRMFDINSIQKKQMKTFITKHIDELHTLRSYTNDCLTNIWHTFKVQNHLEINDVFLYKTAEMIKKVVKQGKTGKSTESESTKNNEIVEKPMKS